MRPFDFFESAELPAPAVTAEQAERIAAEHFGLAAQARALGSQQDANFLLSGADGNPLGVLKIANPAFSLVELEAQDAAAAFIASAEPVRAATNIAPPGAPPIAELTGLGSAGRLFARIIRHLPGGTMAGDGYLRPARVAALGDLAGRACRALAGFDHPGVDRVLQWDPRHGARTVEVLAGHLDDDRRGAVRSAAAAAWRAIAGLADDLPVQVIHGDITGDNVVCARPGGNPDGLIDFGDLMRSWAVAELACAVAALLRHEGGEPAATLPAIRAFHAVRPLAPAELEALWPLVALRSAVLVVSGVHQSAIDADNRHASSALESEWRIFQQANGIPATVMTAQIRHALGAARPAGPLAGAAPLIAGLEPASIARLDLSAQSDGMDGGAWLSAGCEDRLAARAIAAGAPAAVSVFGEARLSRSAALSPVSPATVATGIGVWTAAPVVLSAPWPGRVETVAGGLRLTADPGALEVRGPLRPRRADGDVPAGGELADIEGPVWVQVRRQRGAVPPFVRPEYAAGWLAQVSDPGALLGLPGLPAQVPDGDALRLRRSRAFAAVQELYYQHPPRIERGWRELLIGVDGRCHLDMVNNVAVLGHGRLELADAAARQWRRLNTNSRFNYEAVVALSERLAATVPDPLDTVFLVNSGSEADDLALRLAMAATGRHDVVAVAEAYHGWTYATDAVSTSLADNPNALASRPPWVHTAPSPNSYRGAHRGADAWRYAPEAVAIIEALAAGGSPPAAFICEPLYGTAGGMALPDGYLKAVYAAVRAAGGLAIADEVQVGYGRTGRWFWAFQQQGVVPDIVCAAKAMGNGQPLGAVITTRAIAEAYRAGGYFFSSAGGSPVSCVVGLTVLDVIERDRLLENATAVGDHLKARINRLADRHPLIGAVHGTGLYLGVELVTDRATLAPATAEAAAICERMRELGVIVQPTGDRQNVLKVKPPMCLTRESADYFADMLERVLRTGW